jgi:hypothetical protein
MAKSKSYTKLVIRTSFLHAAIIMFNIIALASFFFIQVGSIFFIVPAAIIDAMYILSQEPVGPKKDAIRPSNQILKLTLIIVLASLIIFSAVFLLQVYKTT